MSEDEEWTISEISDHINSKLQMTLDEIDTISNLCNAQLRNIEEIAGSHLRTSPRTVANLQPPVLSELVVKLLDCLRNCTGLFKRVNSQLSMTKTSLNRGGLEWVGARLNEKATALSTSCVISCESCDRSEPVLDKINCLDLKLAELSQLHNTQLKELHDIKSSITALPPPVTQAEFSHSHSTQLKELEDLTAAIKSRPTPPPPVIDYSQLKLNIHPSTKQSTPPLHPPTNIRKQMSRSSDEIQKKNNVMVYGLNVDTNSAKSSVLKMFEDCGVERISSLADNVVSAHVVSSDKAHPAIRVVMTNQWIVGELLDVARQLKTSSYNKVYLSKDRTPAERERHKKCVEDLKQKIHNYPKIRWAIVRGIVVDKGSFPTVD